jgi:hypothetical protein
MTRPRPTVVVHDMPPDDGPKHIIARSGDALVVLDVEPAPGSAEMLRNLYSGGTFSVGIQHHVGSDWTKPPEYDDDGYPRD